MEAQEKWDKLTEQRREKLLEKHRDINTHDEWWGLVYESFKNDMREIGVHVGAMYFSGFWSQGDGACFNGYVFGWTEFLTAVNKPELVDLAMEHGVSFRWATTGRYCHENTVDFDTNDLWISNPFDEEDDSLRHAAWNAVHPAGGPILAIADHLIEFLKDKMRGLYRSLEEEYEYLTSDEEVTTYVLDHCEDEIDEQLAEQEDALSALAE